MRLQKLIVAVIVSEYVPGAGVVCAGTTPYTVSTCELPVPVPVA